LKNPNIYISLIFSALIAIGITLSTLHSHDSHHHESKTGHSLVVDHNQCVICGSVFQTDNSSLDSSEVTLNSENVYYCEKTAEAFLTFLNSQFGRAPPVS